MAEIFSGPAPDNNRQPSSYRVDRIKGVRRLSQISRQRFSVFKIHYFHHRLVETNVTLLAEVSEIELKRCPRCEEALPLSEFGVCRARKDGLNLYCKRCIRQKISLSRQALREYKKARVKHGGTIASQKGAVSLDGKTAFSSKRIARMLRKLSPAE